MTIRLFCVATSKRNFCIDVLSLVAGNVRARCDDGRRGSHSRENVDDRYLSQHKRNRMPTFG